MDWYQTVAFWAAVAVCGLGFLAGILVWIFNFRSECQIEMLKTTMLLLLGFPLLQLEHLCLSLYSASSTAQSKSLYGVFNSRGHQDHFYCG
jgi:hypothetical protein